MNRHHGSNFKPTGKLVGLTLVAAMSAALGCSSSPGGSTPGTGGSTTGKGGSTGTGGTAAGTGGTAAGTGGTGGSISTGGTGGTSAGGTGGTSAGGTGGTNAGGTGGTSAGGTGGTSAGGTGGGGTGGSAGTGGPPVNLPPTLNVPSGATVKFHLHATGSQIYTCTASSAGGAAGSGAGGTGGSGTTYSFVLKQPDAKLYDATNTQVGTHGAGPNWTSTVDGSVVNGAKVYGENATGTIQWLLLRATSNTGTGVFSDVTYVQRVNTTGGVAPATGCDSTTAGTDTPVAYTADYYFYTGGGPGAAWMAPPVNLQPTLAVPNGATLKIHDHAIGAQVYTCTASAAGGAGGSGTGGAGGGGTTYSFVLKQPDAVLYDSSFAMVGTHGLGPNWTSTDGSIVNGAKVFGENATGAIQWLLLHATSNTGTTGVFSDITYVIRANTAGGVAPTTGCDATTAGTDTRVSYSADYYFYSGGGPGTAWLTPPANLPAAIAVPSGATLKLHDHAIGAQVYTCTASAAGGAGGSGAGGAGGGTTTYAWVLKQPDAVLYDQNLAMAGTHGLGPNWTSTDGSIVNGAKVAGVNSTTTGAIQWLLLMATSNTGTTGVFSDVTYVQRLNTTGGVAPATGCDATTAGTDTRIPYSADYYFFNGGATDGGTGG